MYKIVDDRTVRRISDRACIPLVEGNSDYQDFLDWIIEGNTAEGADIDDSDDLSPVPSFLQTTADAKQFAQQLSAYTTATARLSNKALTALMVIFQKSYKMRQIRSSLHNSLSHTQQRQRD